MLNKKIISFLVAVLLFTGNLAASESRTQSMGQTGIFLKDNSNVTLFPGSTMLYRNLVIAELREYYDENSFSAGIHLPMG
nr:hypothetical protein [Calditrichia bacterium]